MESAASSCCVATNPSLVLNIPFRIPWWTDVTRDLCSKAWRREDTRRGPRRRRSRKLTPKSQNSGWERLRAPCLEWFQLDLHRRQTIQFEIFPSEEPTSPREPTKPGMLCLRRDLEAFVTWVNCYWMNSIKWLLTFEQPKCYEPRRSSWKQLHEVPLKIIASSEMLLYLPQLITSGVIKVKMAVDKIPNPSVYLPPNFSDRIPPGMWVITWKYLRSRINKRRL